MKAQPAPILALSCLALSIVLPCFAHAQPADSALPDAPDPSDNHSALADIPANIGHDQIGIWTSPAHIHRRDLIYLIPLGVATAAAIATDRTTLHDVVSIGPAFNNPNTLASNVLIGGFIATPVAFYGAGHWMHNERARETGVLGAEGILDGLVVQQGLKLIFWRERPSQDNQRGRFFQSSAGFDSSFPSSHCVLAWTVASLVAQEYPHFWVRVAVDSAATGVALTRIMGQQHFPSDVLVGSAAGWIIGRYVYHRHHRHQLDN